MSDRIIWGVTGLIGSGKDMFCDYVEKEYGFLHLSTGFLVRRELDQLGLPKGRKNEVDHGKKRIDEDVKYWPKQIIKGIEEGNAKMALFNGTRQIYDYSVLKEYLEEDYKLICIHADDKVRFGRLNKRGRDKDPETWEEFLEQNEREENTFHTRRDVFPHINFTINNNFKKIEEFHQEIDKFMQERGIKK